MAKSILKTCSHKNVRIGLPNHMHKISKGIIHVQDSFKNSIVTIRGRVISWSIAGTYRFKVHEGKNLLSLIAQTTVGNVI